MGTETEGFQPDGSAMGRLADLAGITAPSRWRKLPVEIEAWQFDVPPDRLPVSLGMAIAKWCGGEFKTQLLGMADPRIEIPTLEGVMSARPGWWVIKGVAGEFYPCDPDVFARTYEPADPASPASLLPVAEPAAERDPSLPDGEYARVEIMGHDEHTGWVTESTRAGQPVMVIRGWDGLVIAEVPGHALYRFLPLPTPLRRPEPRAAIAAAYADAAEDFGESGYDDEGRWP